MPTNDPMICRCCGVAYGRHAEHCAVHKMPFSLEGAAIESQTAKERLDTLLEERDAARKKSFGYRRVIRALRQQRDKDTRVRALETALGEAFALAEEMAGMMLLDATADRYRAMLAKLNAVLDGKGAGDGK